MPFSMCSLEAEVIHKTPVIVGYDLGHTVSSVSGAKRVSLTV